MNNDVTPRAVLLRGRCLGSSVGSVGSKFCPETRGRALQYHTGHSRPQQRAPLCVCVCVCVTLLHTRPGAKQTDLADLHDAGGGEVAPPAVLQPPEPAFLLVLGHHQDDVTPGQRHLVGPVGLVVVRRHHLVDTVGITSLRMQIFCTNILAALSFKIARGFCYCPTYHTT